MWIITSGDWPLRASCAKDTSMRVVACKNEHVRQLDYVITGPLTSRGFKLEFLKRKLRLIEGS